MIRLLLPLLLAALLYAAWRVLARLPPGRRRRVGKGVFWALAIALAVLAISGRIHWLAAALPPLAVAVRWFGRLLAGWPLLLRLLSALGLRGQTGHPGQPGHTGQAGGQERRHQAGGDAPPRAGRSRMTREQALAILGLAEGASREQVIAAHRRLMQKLHPDTGGTNYLAAEVNQARDVLLNRR